MWDLIEDKERSHSQPRTIALLIFQSLATEKELNFINLVLSSFIQKKAGISRLFSQQILHSYFALDFTCNWVGVGNTNRSGLGKFSPLQQRILFTVILLLFVLPCQKWPTIWESFNFLEYEMMAKLNEGLQDARNDGEDAWGKGQKFYRPQNYRFSFPLCFGLWVCYFQNRAITQFLLFLLQISRPFKKKKVIIVSHATTLWSICNRWRRVNMYSFLRDQVHCSFVNPILLRAEFDHHITKNAFVVPDVNLVDFVTQQSGQIELNTISRANIKRSRSTSSPEN